MLQNTTVLLLSEAAQQELLGLVPQKLPRLPVYSVQIQNTYHVSIILNPLVSLTLRLPERIAYSHMNLLEIKIIGL